MSSKKLYYLSIVLPFFLILYVLEFLIVGIYFQNTHNGIELIVVMLLSLNLLSYFNAIYNRIKYKWCEGK